MCVCGHARKVRKVSSLVQENTTQVMFVGLSPQETYIYMYAYIHIYIYTYNIYIYVYTYIHIH